MRIKAALLIGMALSFIAADASALCVKVPTARVRTGPGTEYPVTWEVSRYMPFAVVGGSLSGKWHAVKDIDGDVGWIYKKLVTGGYKCAAVMSDGVHVRKGPGERYPVVENAKRAYAYRIIKNKGKWIQVKDEFGSIGWVHRDYVWIQ